MKNTIHSFKLVLSFLIFHSLIQAENIEPQEWSFKENPSFQNWTQQASPYKKNQVSIRTIERMPSFPEPYIVKDWKTHAKKYDAYVFDPDLKGQYLPLLEWDDKKTNIDRRGFVLPCYVGPKEWANNGTTGLGNVLGATFVGIDKTKGPINWVEACEQYFNAKNGENLVLDRTEITTGNSFWAEVYPQIIFQTIANFYPDQKNIQSVVPICVENWYDAAYTMRDAQTGLADFNYTSYSFKEQIPKWNGTWNEPDAGMGIAWIMYDHWLRTGDKKYLKAAQWCLDYYQMIDFNPKYDVLVNFGAYAAARMNAEQGTGYDLERFFEWCFTRGNNQAVDSSIICQPWGGHGVFGLWGGSNGSQWHGRTPGGYVFTMESFSTPWPLVPIARYDKRFARMIGKWMQNVAVSSRYFFRDAHPKERQSCPNWEGDPDNLIGYEAIAYRWLTPFEEPFTARGDVIVSKWPYHTDFSLYGTGFVGVLGSIIEKTDVEGILKLDLLATDHAVKGKAYPTFIFYNPFNEKKTVKWDIGKESFDLYETISEKWVQKAVSGVISIEIPPDQAVELVKVPAGAKITQEGVKTLANGIVIDFGWLKNQLNLPQS